MSHSTLFMIFCTKKVCSNRPNHRIGSLRLPLPTHRLLGWWRFPSHARRLRHSCAFASQGASQCIARPRRWWAAPCTAGLCPTADKLFSVCYYSSTLLFAIVLNCPTASILCRQLAPHIFRWADILARWCTQTMAIWARPMRRVRARFRV